jgi:Protein of unknown function (DUF2800)
MTEHSLLGASSAYRWLSCPGSFHLSQQHPHRPSSIYAATGSLAHDYIEKAVGAGAIEIDQSAIGQVWSRDSHTGVIDQDFVDGVNVMLEYISRGAEWKEVEFRVSLDDYFTDPPVPMFGTVDAGLLTLGDRTLEVVDYKNGAGVVVTPKENPQLLYYGAGVLRHLPPGQRDRVENIKLTIVQPHAQGVAPIRSWETSPVDLLMWVDETLVPGVEACAQDNAPLVPGSWCRFCPVSHACPRLQQDAVAMAKREFDDGDMPQKPSDLAHALDVAERAQLWIDRVREYALEQLQHQVRIPGWGLTPTRPTRKWVSDEDEVAARLLDEGLNRRDVWEQKLRSPAQVEKQLRRLGMTGRGWDVLASELVEAKSSGVKLSRTGTTAGEDFVDAE